MPDLQEINLGRLDAESDPKLADYFVETGAVGSILRGKQLILGRKGTGKTALFLHLEDNLDHAVNLDLNEYLFMTHRSLRESGVAEASSYTSAWKLVIYTAIVGSLKKELTRGQKTRFRNILEKLQMSDDGNKFAQLASWLKRVKRVDLPGIGDFATMGGFELDDQAPRFVGVEFLSAVLQLEELAKEVITQHRVSVLIDRIDDVWDGTEESRNFIAGALKALRQINLYPRKADSATVILFLRTDLWQDVIFNDRNKMSQDIEHLNWSNDDLVAVINARIRPYASDRKEAWYEIFFDGEMRQRASSQKYILNRTMGRPRDILAYATFALEEAQRQDHSKILAEDIYASETRYSAHILEELNDEMASSLNWPKVLSTLKTLGRRNFSWDEWFSASDDQGLNSDEAKTALTELFEASVVGERQVGGGGGGSRSRYRYQDSYLQPKDDSFMQVHLAVVKELNLKDS